MTHFDKLFIAIVSLIKMQKSQINISSHNGLVPSGNR